MGSTNASLLRKENLKEAYALSEEKKLKGKSAAIWHSTSLARVERREAYSQTYYNLYW